ncbi:MAG: DMT family transporter [Actinomycetota bacterium]|nr:DMT family transporter [Actinomycetota bacterium]
MASNSVVVALTLTSAFAFSVSTTLKKASSAQVPPASEHAAGLGRFIRATLSHPLWLAGLGADAVGLGLQVVALHIGALAVVQPLLVSGLLFALLLRHRRTWHISGREVLWATVLAGCLVAFLSLSGSVSGGQHPSSADRLPAVVAAVVGLLTAVGSLAIARKRLPPAGRAALIGVAVGVVYAATAALIKAATDVLSSHGWSAVLLSWQLYAVVALGAFGLFLSQLAFQAGPLTASLPSMATVDPLLSIVIGVLVYDEHLRRGPLSGLLLLGLMLLLATSVVQLSSVEGAEVNEPVAVGPH